MNMPGFTAEASFIEQSKVTQMKFSGIPTGSPCRKTSERNQIAAFVAVRFFKTLLVLLAITACSISGAWIATEARAEAIRATTPTTKPSPAPAGTIETKFQYAVKAICGNFDDRSLSRGIYHTAINSITPQTNRLISPRRWRWQLGKMNLQEE
jgi:hypothetical protein